jgi:hypothetical protein
MLRVPRPVAAVDLGLPIVQELLGGHGAPAVRVGMHRAHLTLM